MHAVIFDPPVYSALAVSVLLLHALFILWVGFGVLLARSSPILRWLHIGSVVWGILMELLPWACPLTVLENWLEGKAGIKPEQGPFLLHYLDKLVYPNISPTALTIAAVTICTLNLALHARQVWNARTDKHRSDTCSCAATASLPGLRRLGARRLCCLGSRTERFEQ